MLDAIKELSCLGIAADMEAISLALGRSKVDIRKDLWEAVRVGLVTHWDDYFKFAHDRVWEATYSLIPLEVRPSAHLRIGRRLLNGMDSGLIVERIFDVVGQLNGAILLVAEWAEKEKIADLNLRAARQAKASAAYGSACKFLSKATLLLGEQAWVNCRDFAFQVWLEKTECEFLNGHFEVAEQLLGDLLNRCVTRIEKAAVYRIKIDLHVVKSQNACAIDSGLECLGLFGFHISPHPTREEVMVEYENVWRTLGKKPVRELIDLPLTPDPEIAASVRLLSVLFAPSIFTDLNLTCLILCKMLDLSMRHGNTDAAAVGYAWFGAFVGPVFGRYPESYEFAKLAGAFRKVQPGCIPGQNIFCHGDRLALDAADCNWSSTSSDGFSYRS